MMLGACVAISYMQGVGGRKSARIVVWACYIVSPWYLSLGSLWCTEPRVDRQTGL